MKQSIKNCWDVYWEQNVKTSFGTSLDNYEGTLLEVWQNFAYRLTGEVNILDVGSGNGAVPILLDKYCSTSVTGSISGVDKAKVRATIDSKKLKISLFGQTDVANLPFPGDCFDYVVSQFGFEYGYSTKSVNELMRVMRKNAKLLLVLHNRDSFIFSKNRAELRFLSSPQMDLIRHKLVYFVEQLGPLRSSEDIVNAKKNTRLETLRLEFFTELKKLWELDNQNYINTGISNALTHLFSTGISWSIEEKLDFISRLFNGLNSHKQRLEQLVDAALNEAQFKQITENLMMHGCEIISSDVLHERDGQILAWKLDAVKK